MLILHLSRLCWRTLARRQWTNGRCFTLFLLRARIVWGTMFTESIRFLWDSGSVHYCQEMRCDFVLMGMYWYYWLMYLASVIMHRVDTHGLRSSTLISPEPFSLWARGSTFRVLPSFSIYNWGFIVNLYDLYVRIPASDCFLQYL